MQAIGAVTVASGAPDASKTIVSLASNPAGSGYWMVASDGSVYAFGGAPFLGGANGTPLRTPIVDIAATPTGLGYFLVAADGGVFTYGDALFQGSMGGQRLSRPVVAVAATPSGQGYFLVGGDGSVFTFGNAKFAGSLPSIHVPGDIVDVVVRPQGDGYWLIGSDGAAFAFGAAPNVHGLPDHQIRPQGRVVGAASTPSGTGLWFASTDGGVFAVGDAPFLGAGTPPAGQRIAAIASNPAGTGLWLASTAGLLPAKPGDRGEGVRLIQQRLLDLGYWLAGPSGSYELTTQQAVMAFQKYSGLERDGVAGPVTADLLSRAVHPQAATVTGDIIEVDKARQVMFVVVGGQTQWVLNVSTGSDRAYVEKSGLDGSTVTGDAKTPVGHFKVYFERDVGWWESDLGKLWRPKYFIAGFAVHGSDSVPGFPASHGCVRVSVPGMNFIWDANLMPEGRSVWIY
ncbi:MAG: hypothetical protein JWL70_2234 [Acidimicrobiia bacterium]|nr:hypothetical protein [Acidimicrobiia bacterium]